MAEGALDVMREEMLENATYPKDPVPVQTEWEDHQWKIIDQLRAKVNYLQNKLNEHTDKEKDNKYLYK